MRPKYHVYVNDGTGWRLWCRAHHEASLKPVCDYLKSLGWVTRVTEVQDGRI